MNGTSSNSSSCDGGTGPADCVSEVLVGDVNAALLQYIPQKHCWEIKVWHYVYQHYGHLEPRAWCRLPRKRDYWLKLLCVYRDSTVVKQCVVFNGRNPHGEFVLRANQNLEITFNCQADEDNGKLHCFQPITENLSEPHLGMKTAYVMTQGGMIIFLKQHDHNSPRNATKDELKEWVGPLEVYLTGITSMISTTNSRERYLPY